MDDWTRDATIKTGDDLLVRRFRLEVRDVPGVETWESSTDRCSMGSHPSNDLVLPDPTVSRFHCEIWLDEEGAHVRDLGSRNGTRVDGVRAQEAWLRNGSQLRVGRTGVSFSIGESRNELPVSRAHSFGTMVGRSVAIRAVFAQLERAARHDVTVLLGGETGTGKEEAAISIHESSPRAEEPFVVVDCGAIPPALAESQLFGHEPGSFTGATRRRIGAFEQADGGTIFLDEVGELPLDMQPKLLRVLEQRVVRRVGGTRDLPVDVRVVAATNRDLRSEVSAGQFREDLYYRLAVIRVVLPPLRSRPEDIPVLVERILGELSLDAEATARLRDPAFLASLSRATWRGNVRELRNHLERAAVLVDPEPIPTAAEPSVHVDARLSYADARRVALERFEESYASRLVELHGGNVSKAARAAGMGRTYLHRLLRRHGVDRE
jgi:DNA-binding NtrC family response regulator